MDPLKKVTDDLALLGGELSIDRFLEARQAAAPPPQPKAARPAQPAQKPSTPAVEKARVASRKPEADPGSDPSGASDTGKLRLEIEAFMNRDSAEDADDREVQEFLKDRSGFDPSELE